MKKARTSLSRDMTRKEARNRVLYLLFEIDVGGESPEEVLQGFQESYPREEPEASFVVEMVEGIANHLSELDELIDCFSPEWSVNRMASADRNILRIACYELLYRADIPSAVSINEAVVLAKRFGGVESGKFVNGILGAIARSGIIEEKEAALE